MRIILLGPPGAGKGTQSKTLAQRLKLTHISTGDILRQNVTSGTQLGKQAKKYMNKGALVPDDLVTQMLIDRISQPDVKQGFILDGYPRNINQANVLDDMLDKLDMKIDFVFYLDTSVEVIIQRLTGRRVCKKCGANFHIKNMPPKVDGICDNCGGELYQRSDDNEQTIKARLEIYENESSSLIKHYQSKGRLFKLSADGGADKVLEEIIDIVAEK